MTTCTLLSVGILFMLPSTYPLLLLYTYIPVVIHCSLVWRIHTLRDLILFYLYFSFKWQFPEFCYCHLLCCDSLFFYFSIYNISKVFFFSSFQITSCLSILAIELMNAAHVSKEKHPMDRKPVLLKQSSNKQELTKCENILITKNKDYIINF